LVRRPRPGWKLEEDVALDQLVTELVVDPDADDNAAYDAVGRFWSTPLDPGLPCWRMLLVRGMRDGRSVLAVKMHHSAGDGVSALGLLDRMLDSGPEGEPPNHPSPSGTSRPLDPARTLGGLWSLASRGRPPRHPMNRRPVGAGRQFVSLRVPAAPLRTAARALGAHPHELALATVADAIGRLLGP